MTEQTPPKKRGGQPGNTNALKHGCYAHGNLLRRAQRDLNLPPLSLTREQQFLTLLFQRIEKQFGQSLAQCSPTEKTHAVFVLSLYILANLLHTNAILNGVMNPAVETALAETIDQLLAQ